VTQQKINKNENEWEERRDKTKKRCEDRTKDTPSENFQILSLSSPRRGTDRAAGKEGTPQRKKNSAKCAWLTERKKRKVGEKRKDQRSLMHL